MAFSFFFGGSPHENDVRKAEVLRDKLNTLSQGEEMVSRRSDAREEWKLRASNYESQDIELTQIKSGSSVDLRGYSTAKPHTSLSTRSSLTMNSINEEIGNILNEPETLKNGNARKLSKQQRIANSGDFTTLELENPKEKSSPTDSVNTSVSRDSLGDKGEDYVLDTTAYVCSVIDTLGLSEEERNKILQVVARDEHLRVKEKQKIL